jgi:hypothetical protein
MARKSTVLYRQCPACRVVHRAAELQRAARLRLLGPERKAVCPSCGHVAPAPAFPKVERPAAVEPSEGTG